MTAPEPASRKPFASTRVALFLSLLAGMLSATSARAQTPASAPNPLRALSGSIERLANDVSVSVVQVMVTGYGLVNGPGSGETGLVVGRQRSLGAGVIVSEDGYIVTNAHVVTGAQRVRVLLHGPAPSPDAVGQFLSGDNGPTIDAKIVGVAKDIDLALLKIDRKGLKPLPFADYHKTHQGELVFAFGSPEGLRNSVTMGVISAVARQTDPDSPTLYIQTDAPINPGNSGGPLVNVDGELVGINTFILSESGGSQGLGFAIPSAVVSTVYPILRDYGHYRRGILGIDIQANSPELAAGLHLAKSTGVLVADVLPDGPADGAGLKPKDLITSIDGKPTNVVPMFGIEMSMHQPGDTVTLGILRDGDEMSLKIPVIEEPSSAGRLGSLADPAANTVPQLGIVGVDITEDTSDLVPGIRIPSGVFVAAREQGAPDTENPLTTGDIIHSVNDYNIRSLDGLRAILDGYKSHNRVVLQIERDGRLRFITMRVS